MVKLTSSVSSIGDAASGVSPYSAPAAFFAAGEDFPRHDPRRPAATYRRPDRAAADALVEADLQTLMQEAEALTLEGFGRVVTYSRKVFIPLTHLCRDVCHYCTFAKAPRKVMSPFLSLSEVVSIAQAGAAAGCKEALFTLGDKPELRYTAARQALDAMGHATTLDYLEAAAREVYEKTGLLPHLNPGVMTRAEVERLRKVSVSMGIMLETSSARLSERGGPHWGSPDKQPAVRLETLQAAGELAVPFTSGILIGIGETRRERIDSLFALREVHDRYGHLQEIIIQNFRAKPGTKMAAAPEPSLDEHLWTIAAARLIFGPSMSLQAPPNLRSGELDALVRAGINDWGGVSPVTPDHVNPEAPWPHLVTLEEQTAQAGRHLLERLAIGPAHAQQPAKWLDASLRAAVLRRADSAGRARTEAWYAGSGSPLPAYAASLTRSPRNLPTPEISAIVARAWRGTTLNEAEIVRLFDVQGDDLRFVLQSADRLRAEVSGERVSYVVNRNINYTNICYYKCGFCAFSKGKSSADLRGPAYLLDVEEIARRSVEAYEKGATEVCLQGGIHPSYTGDTYLGIVKAVKAAVPQMHVHAFSPLEITQGARTLGLPLREYLQRLKEAGLSTLPGTAAEILDDEVRAIICADKIDTDEWLEVMRTAHGVGLRTTATIMYGHVESAAHWARHLLRIRGLQLETGGFTEFVPLPFVHMEAPMWRKGLARSGPLFSEALLMHAVARLVLHPVIRNIQTSWVKMGPEGAALALQSGANDLGGTLMNESITRAAGGVNGQEFDRANIERLAQSVGRPVYQRTTLYKQVSTAPVHEPTDDECLFEPLRATG